LFIIQNAYDVLTFELVARTMFKQIFNADAQHYHSSNNISLSSRGLNFELEKYRNNALQRHVLKI